jgi:hypothetical protein
MSPLANQSIWWKIFLGGAMIWIVQRLVACTVFIYGLQSASFAAPPASCASKYIGTWAYPGGTTTVSANGLAFPHCPMCVPVQTWTCQGNTFLFSNSGPPGQFTATLVDSNHMNYGTGISTRVGARATPSNPTSSDQPAATASPATAKQLAAPPKSVPSEQTSVAATSLTPQRSSCSDITGTKDTSPAASDCKDAGSSLRAARVIRKQYPEYAEEQYKKAAAAARRAGDTNLELSILREATVPAAPEPPPPDPASDDACAAPMREAAADITGAQAIERNDPSCAGLLHAAENYFSAGRIFFRSIKPGMSSDQVVNSCANKKTNEMFLRRDALIYRVDRMREAGKCDPAIAANPPPPPPPPPPPDQDLKKRCAEKLQILKPHAVNDQWLKDQMATGEVKCNAPM